MVISGTALAAPSKSACDPATAAIDSAVALRDAGNAHSAAARLNAIIAQYPNSFRAQYILGTTLIQESAKQSAGEGLQRLLAAEKLLPSQTPYCVSEYGWYSIYNSIGAQYFKNKDYSLAISYYKLGLTHYNELYEQPQRELAGNLGLYYFQQGDLDQSLIYYQMAQKARSHQAAARIATVKSLIAMRSR
jgi:tetratricopeptide (TPR) repeat protein